MSAGDAQSQSDAMPGTSPQWFATTHWSVVLLAGQGESADAQEALAKLCATYRSPILAFAQRLGLSHADAEDLTQGFFAHFLEKNLAGKAQRREGVKFRTFLLRCFKNFLADQRDRATAKKRGGPQAADSLDQLTEAQPAHWEPSDERSAEKLYERNWATTLLNQVLNRLEGEYQS
jgi:DNA-directed RNA polymerase specialized sigma24 family protein